VLGNEIRARKSLAETSFPNPGVTHNNHHSLPRRWTTSHPIEGEFETVSAGGLKSYRTADLEFGNLE
jgi:hypothetical protein